jgi:peptidoglycan/LPS O-acetylase OafA/YrhL
MASPAHPLLCEHTAMSAASAFFTARSRTVTGYRPDIDGLRGIAVLAVVLYHWDIPGIGDGLYGVDIFFVISGYLITQLLLAESAIGPISVRAFYVRRLRRIAPALFVVVLATSAAFWCIAPPFDIERLGATLLASVAMVANLFFLGTTGDYFAPAAQNNPLLHLWSLAVEEQFYLVLPWLLVVGGKWPRGRLKWVLALLCVLSFACALALGARSRAATFYFPGSRAWELLLGGLLALPWSSAKPPRWMLHLAGALGVVLVGLSIKGSAITLLPAGAGPLAACVGAALVIASGAGQRSAIAQALSFRPLVGVGLISYSLYLWHWPLLVAYRTAFPLDRSGDHAVLAATFLLAAASWHFVERPFREPNRVSSPVVVRCVVAAAGAIVGLGMLMILSDGGSSRFSPEVRRLYHFERHEASQVAWMDRCLVAPRQIGWAGIDQAACLTPTPGKPVYLIAGDSHGAALAWGLREALPEVSVVQATASGCRPLVSGVQSVPCVRFMHQLFEEWVRAAKPDVVVLVARWSVRDVEPLKHTVAALGTSSKVIVIGPAIEYAMDLPRLMALAEIQSDPSLVARGRMRHLDELDLLLRLAIEGSEARYISLHQMLCREREGECLSRLPDGTPLQFDYGHFSQQGSVFVGHQLRAELAPR